LRDAQDIGRRLDTHMQVAGAVTRKAFLQGAPRGLREALASRPEVVLPTSGTFTQQLTVRCQGVFDAQPLQAVTVSIAPEIVPLSAHVFDAAHAEEWRPELVHQPGAGSPYTYQCQLHFGGPGSGVPCASGRIAIPRGQAYLDVVPEEFYTWRRYRVSAADDFPWGLLKSLTLAPRGPGGLTFHPTTLVLGAEAPAGDITAFAPGPGSLTPLDDVAYTASFQPAEGTAFTLEGIPAGATIFLNPFRARTVTFQAAPGFDWNAYDRVEVRPERRNGTPQLWPEPAAPVTLTREAPAAGFRYWFADDRTLAYRVAFLRNGERASAAKGQTTELRVPISPPPGDGQPQPAATPDKGKQP
jgi:hypothetical protein